MARTDEVTGPALLIREIQERRSGHERPGVVLLGAMAFMRGHRVQAVRSWIGKAQNLAAPWRLPMSLAQRADVNHGRAWVIPSGGVFPGSGTGAHYNKAAPLFHRRNLIVGPDPEQGAVVGDIESQFSHLKPILGNGGDFLHGI